MGRPLETGGITAYRLIDVDSKVERAYDSVRDRMDVGAAEAKPPTESEAVDEDVVAERLEVLGDT